MDITIKGPQGCGKTTTAQMIAQNYLGKPLPKKTYECTTTIMPSLRRDFYATVYVNTCVREDESLDIREVWVFDEVVRNKDAIKQLRRFAKSKAGPGVNQLRIYILI